MCKIFDAHCDTIYELKQQGKNLANNQLHLDISRMEEFDTYIQVFAAFVDKKNIKTSPLKHCVSLIDKYKEELIENSDRISAIESAVDLERAVTKGGIYSILSLEGGEALEGSLDSILMFYKLGVRLITLTWNYANELCDGICESRGGGLTQFGKEAIKIMEDMGIVIDVSHISEKGFWDVAEYSRYPFVASHSCAKALCGHKRNLSDAQIRKIIDSKGCIGINFYPEFLQKSGDCHLNMIIRHIEYVLDMGGENSVGLGSDFDGVSSLPRQMAGVQNMQDIASLIKTAVKSQEITDKILYGNFYRVFSGALQRGDKFSKT